MADILYVITDLHVGGVPLHLHHVMGAMKRRGHSVAVVSLAPTGPVGGMIADDGIDVETCAGCGGWDFRVVSRLARIIARRRPDIVHALLFHANVASRWAAASAGFPWQRVICEIQTVEVERRWHLLVDRFTHGGCRFTIGNSASVVDHLARAACIPRDRLRLVRGGISVDRIRSAQPVERSALGLAAKHRLILWAGRLDPVKGLDVLIEAFSGLGRDLDAHLLLAGDGPLRDTLSRLIEQLHVSDRVHLLGSRKDVPSLLKTADVFAFPSRTEGLPNALLEAMAAGCPIVTTDAPGCRDLVEGEKTGLVVPYGDTAALTCALVRLLTDSSLASSLGGRAREVVLREWRIERTYDQYARIYEEVLEVGA